MDKTVNWSTRAISDIGIIIKRIPEICSFIIFLVLTLVIYRNTLTDVPRSDHLEIFAMFQNLHFPHDISRIAFMEFFGHVRFQPLAWIIHFFQIFFFGNNFWLYHFEIIFLHAINGALLFAIISRFSNKRLLAFLISLIFITLFTNISIIAWPIASYSILGVTMSLLGILSLLHYFKTEHQRYLYISYSLAFIQMFLYELHALAPIFLFLFAVFIAWQKDKRWRHITRNGILALVCLAGYLSIYVACLPFIGVSTESILSFESIVRALSSVPLEFFSTVFGHNVFASSKVVIDELLFFVPFTPKSFSLMATEPRLVYLNSLVYLVLAVFVVSMRRPLKGRAIWLILPALWAIGYTAMIFLERNVAYVLSQDRHAYFPSLLLLIVLAIFFEKHFVREWWLMKKSRTFIGRNGAILFIAACLFVIGLNVYKTSSLLVEYMNSRKYTNDIYYAVNNWLAHTNNQSDKLFLSIPTYAPDEKLAWGTDIIPDLFLNHPRITKHIKDASYILSWNNTLNSPVIKPNVEYSTVKPNDDFMLVFGIMPHPQISEEYIEILSNKPQPSGNTLGKQWWVRLYFNNSQNYTSGIAGEARLVLGYSRGSSGHKSEARIFTSQPITIQRSRMNHMVLVRENNTFGFIFNGTLVSTAPDYSEENFDDVNFALGPIYSMGYRKPYYYAHTFLQFGATNFSLFDKKLGYVFKEIKFNPYGFQEYHMQMQLP